MLLTLVDRVEIENDPCSDYEYRVQIHRNGRIEYKNNTDNKDEATIFIKSDKAAYIIDPIMTELFCYDSDNHGAPAIDGYHWKLSFYKRDRFIDVIEGGSNEDRWRYDEVKRILAFAQRYIPFDLGGRHMNK